MRIYFARHGESQANRLHEIANRGLRHGLTRRGRGQVARLAAQLRRVPLTRIYTSPLLRALETAVILADQLGLDYEVTDALREYDCGIIEGRSDEAGWAQWQQLFDAWTVSRRSDQRLEGGESFEDVRRRFVPFIEGLVEGSGKTEDGILCVSHGGLYALMLPLVVTNLDRDLMAVHGWGYATCLTTELRPDSLVCTEWDGRPLPEEAALP